MAVPVFKVGDIVVFTSNAALSRSGAYEVIRLLPSDGPDALYRLKSVGEPYERVAREYELHALKVAERVGEVPANEPIRLKPLRKPRRS